MRYLRHYQRILCAFLATALLSLSINQVAVAAIVTTEQLVSAKEIDVKREQIRDWLARDDVRELLVSRGVDPQQAKERVASMTDNEVVGIANKIDTMPAGGDVLGLLLLIFLVLIVTDILGITDVFTFIKKR
ncbi:MAG: PA2779 family protein [Gammaproteobacteria bacterium]|nr:PA2779 family protein [Gammaproteobacteria bacterium]